MVVTAAILTLPALTVPLKSTLSPLSVTLPVVAIDFEADTATPLPAAAVMVMLSLPLPMAVMVSTTTPLLTEVSDTFALAPVITVTLEVSKLMALTAELFSARLTLPPLVVAVRFPAAAVVYKIACAPPAPPMLPLVVLRLMLFAPTAIPVPPS